MKNPAEFAQPIAQKMMEEGYLTGSDYEGFDVDQERFLTYAADFLDLLERPYAVEATAAIILPLDAGVNSPCRFDELRFTGELTEYSVVNSPRSMGRRAINALCLSFRNVTLLPHNDRPRDIVLHVPVFAVPSIDPLVG